MLELSTPTITGASNRGPESSLSPSRISAETAAPRVDSKRLSRWEVLDGLHDAWTVVSSIVDIITDIIVAYAFNKHGQQMFFILSLVIFVVAQLSYAFLFTGTWAASHSIRGKLLVFACVLPFGQLIPIFAWLESFRFPMIDAWLKSLKLTPTGTSGEALATENLGAVAAAAETGDGDSLWEFIQRKYAAHAGFLAEAFVEAIPQGVLQTVAVLVLPRPADETKVPWLNVFSILMSIAVVASKGYLVAYSLHRPSFAFNYTCIAGDAFNLFATATWLFLGLNGNEGGNEGGSGGSGGGEGGGPLERHPWFCFPALVGLACCCSGGASLLLFTVFDDHLKALHPGVYPGVYGSNALADDRKAVWFDVYLVRILAWLLAVVPVSVVYVSAKLSLLPVLLFGSLDPEHAVHAGFYRPMFQFLAGRVGSSPTNVARSVSGGGGGASAAPGLSVVSALHNATHYRDRAKFGPLDRQLRLQIANQFLLAARNSEGELTKALIEGQRLHNRNGGGGGGSGSGGSGGGGGLKRMATTTAVAVSAVDLTVEAASRLSLQRWLQDCVETTGSTRTHPPAHATNKSSATDSSSTDKEDPVGAAAAAGHMSDEALEQGVRVERLRALRDGALEHGNAQLQARSEILRHFFLVTPILSSSSSSSSSSELPPPASADQEEEQGQRGEGGLLGLGRLGTVLRAGFQRTCSQLCTDLALACHTNDPQWFQKEQKAFSSPSSSSFFPVNRGLHHHHQQPPQQTDDETLFPAHTDKGKRQRCCWQRLRRSGAALRRFLLRLGGLSYLLVVLLSASVLLPASLLFVAYSAVFPVHQMATRCPASFDFSSSSRRRGHDDGDDDGHSAAALLLLPCVLSWGYVACLVILFALAPLVAKFQTARADLRSAKGFPEVFYCKLVVADVFRRYEAAKARLEVNRAVHTRVGRFNAIAVFSFLDEGTRHLAYH